MNTVIYHSNDFDGIFCREIAKRFLEPDAKFIGWTHGDPKIPMPPEGSVYVLDLSPECLDFSEHKDTEPSQIIWIDHHKSSIEKWTRDIPGYRIDGVAACRLTWQWFSQGWHIPNTEHYPKPVKEDFLTRKVVEPIAVRLAGEYDVWDHRGDGDLELQYGLRCGEPNWTMLLNPYSERHTLDLVEKGKIAMAYAKHVDDNIVKFKAFVLDWEGMKFLCLNHPRCNSNTFASKDVPETGHDALLAFYYEGKQWIVSLYHAGHNREIDLSKIAVKYGGGGHRGACGFQCKILPFLS